ncbi:hypothetical protein SAMN04487895_10162 [Paenibacillus sophorae]|uniref:Uncharacterized protein n=1 Tax=Paenibacillus sophorae TaxID=1333845 RepID=A0A1H8FBM6_9BACL|nr:hypothetical protein [Paenibacillus sophorae]QWU13828.1 hypothetical protein KP014_17890 [Paenibacillus sophorae]SEN29152.1 hypothetical protein SAMN04487895_10162 [Paenibacillus sophorae]
MKLLVEEARPMYEAAAAFKKLECWNWLSNSHIFGIQNPESDEIGYCCVMGNGGEMYGIAIYLGTEGLDVLLKLLRGELQGNPLFVQHCLLMSFGGRDELYPEEYKQIKDLGLSFRGRTAWPTFRLYEPGYVPWPVMTEEHLRYFSLCLEQAAALALEVQDDPDYLFEGQGERFLVRIPELAADQQHVWTSRWVVPKPLVEKNAELAPINEIRCAHIRKMPQPDNLVWEAGLYYLPAPVMEGERPYYPQLFIIGEQTTGMIIHSGLKQKDRILQHCADDLLSLLEKMNTRPAKLLFADEEMARTWLHLLGTLEIEVYVAERLPLLEEAVEDIINYFG